MGGTAAMDGEIIKLDSEIICEQTKELEDFMLEKVVNQSRAVRCVVSAYDGFHSPLWQPEKPILSALFLGPSGVGKTLIAEVLAEYFFDDPAAFTKIECANYVERHEIAKLLGSPPGYIGHNEPPLLSQNNIEMPAFKYFKANLMKTDEKARQLKEEMEKAEQDLTKTFDQSKKLDFLAKIYMIKTEEFEDYVMKKINDTPLISIILFDEVEKAHSSLHNFLLEITSKGRTRLGNGEETFFYNSFIFMTSNAGSRSIAEIIKGQAIGFTKEKTAVSGENEIYTRATLELKKTFSPEFLGRIEKNIVVFRNLNKEDMRKIMDIMIKNLLTHLAKTFPIELIIGDEVKNLILETALDHPEYGARLLKDKLDKYIKEPLGRMTNSGQISKGDRVIISLENGKVVFSKNKIAAIP